MPNDAKADHTWEEEMIAFARSKKPFMERGCHPKVGKWKIIYQKIMECLAHVGVVGIGAFFGAKPKKVACKCSYHDKKEKKTETDSAKARPGAVARDSPPSIPKSTLLAVIFLRFQRCFCLRN